MPGSDWHILAMSWVHFTMLAFFSPRSMACTSSFRTYWELSLVIDLEAVRGSGVEKVVSCKAPAFGRVSTWSPGKGKLISFGKELWRPKALCLSTHIRPGKSQGPNVFPSVPWFWHWKFTRVVHLVLFAALLSYKKSPSLILSTMFSEATGGHTRSCTGGHLASRTSYIGSWLPWDGHICHFCQRPFYSIILMYSKISLVFQGSARS